jgi:predicted transposase/invertase (TIGR01784 family)
LQVTSIIKETIRKGKGALLRAYWNAILLANPKAVEEAMKMGNATLTLEKVLKNAGLTEKWKAEGKAEGKVEGKVEGKAEGKIEVARKLIQKGWSAEDIAETTELSLDKIQALYHTRTRRKTN